MARTKPALAACAAAIVGGIALYVTAPATSLVYAPKYEIPAGVSEGIDTSVTPLLSDFYDVTGVSDSPPGTLIKAEPI